MQEKVIYIIKDKKNSSAIEVEDLHKLEELRHDSTKLNKDNSITIGYKIYAKSPDGEQITLTTGELLDLLGMSGANQVSYDNTASGLDAENAQDAVDEVQANIEQEAIDRQLAIETAGFVQRTGTAITFDKWATYGTYDTPVSGNLSYSFADMVKGMIQVMYHQDMSAPAVLQAGVTVIQSGDYVVENVNKITVHCIDEDVIEVNIKAL